MMSKKNKIILISIVSITIILSTLLIFLMFNLNPKIDDSSNNKDSNIEKVLTVDEMVNEAAKALSDNDTSKARRLYQQARDSYMASGNDESAIDMESKIYLIDHPYTVNTGNSLNIPAASGSGGASN